MNAPFDLRLDKAAFDRWLSTQERKHEWRQGRVVQMTNVTRAHASIVANILMLLGRGLDLDRWLVLASDFGVEDETFVSFPDVLVEPAGGDAAGRRALAPTLLFEVLSPSSIDTDMLEKPVEYMSIPSVETYLVLSQDEPICWCWTRDPLTRAAPSGPAKVQGRDQSIQLPSMGLTLPLAEIYRGIRTTEDR